MAAPRGGVAGHEEADGHDAWGGLERGGGGGLGEVVCGVFVAEVGEDGEGAGLVESCGEDAEG